MIDRATVLARMAVEHADVPRGVIGRLAVVRPNPPDVEDLCQDTWVDIAAHVRSLPTDPEHQRSLIAQRAAWIYWGRLQTDLGDQRDSRRVDTFTALVAQLDRAARPAAIRTTR